ncbi:MAG TPA: proline--tRNA ligase [Candidatus Saccharimonadales bacterium]|nr:proline--tRNA ligase [Candidatus Saccharimonadales bacterium]
MRYSKVFGKTSKTEGSDYKIDSHRLLTQAGFIRESTAGRYYLLPLGQKVHEKITDIVRRHMDKYGAQEVSMPVLHPIELWQETNRTSTTGFELMKITDRREAEFALGGTAEEMAVDLVRKFNISYKNLPFNIYQFSMKFRDELRARGGLLRVREFIMKDAYSFSTKEQFEKIYEDMSRAYSDIFSEVGLETEKVRADNGYIGGEYCHEFICQSEAGESRYFVSKSGEAAHEDVAEVHAELKNTDDKEEDIKEVKAERGKTMEDGVKLHDLPLWLQIKDVLYFDESTKKYVLAVIRGDYDVNETKLMHLAEAWDLRAATDKEIKDDLNSEPGFISPVDFPRKSKSGKKVVVIADKSLRTIKNAYGGANKKHRDLMNINIDRDYKPDIEGDIALAVAGEGTVEKRGIEVGNIFQLGYHYTDLMKGAEYTDENGKKQKYYMGCYGIGIGRTMAAVVEKYHDDKGIIWPENIAPFKVYLAVLGTDKEVCEQAEKFYGELQKTGVEVLFDDRDVRPGEKFADADLIGLPYRVVISEKSLKSGGVEFKKRTSKETEILSQEGLIARLKNK